MTSLMHPQHAAPAGTTAPHSTLTQKAEHAAGNAAYQATHNTQGQNHSMNPPLHSNTSVQGQDHSMNPLHDNTTGQHHSMNPLHSNTANSAYAPTAGAGIASSQGSAYSDQSRAEPLAQKHHSLNPLHRDHDTTHHKTMESTAAGTAAAAAHEKKASKWNKKAKIGRIEFGVREALSVMLILGTMALTIAMMSWNRWATVPTVSGGTARVGLRGRSYDQPAGVAPGAQIDNSIVAGGANFNRGGTAVIILGSLALLAATLAVLMFLCSICKVANLKSAARMRRFTILMTFMAAAFTTLASLVYAWYLNASYAYIIFSLCAFLFNLAGIGLLAGAPNAVLHHSQHNKSGIHLSAPTQANTAASSRINSPRHGQNMV